VPASAVAADPFETAPGPSPLTRPADLFLPQRLNSRGLDITDPLAMAALDAERARFADTLWTAAPTMAEPGDAGEPFRIASPATGAHVGDATGAGPASIAAAISAAVEAAPGWAARPVGARAALLRNVADLYEANAAEFYVLCAREAGKVLSD